MLQLEKEIHRNTYEVVNGKWTIAGKTMSQCSLMEQKALGEHVSYAYKNE
ncbi:hypothetical protein PANI_CDS0037 [Maribacter phage Panino]